MNSKIQLIRTSISNNQIDDAIREMKQLNLKNSKLRDEVLTISAKRSELNNLKRNNLLNANDISQEQNKLNLQILTLLNIIEEGGSMPDPVSVRGNITPKKHDKNESLTLVIKALLSVLLIAAIFLIFKNLVFQDSSTSGQALNKPEVVQPAVIDDAAEENITNNNAGINNAGISNAEEAAREKERSVAEEAAREKERLDAEETARKKERSDAEEAAREKERSDAEEAAREKERLDAEEAAREKKRSDAEEAAREKERSDAEEAAARERVERERVEREQREWDNRDDDGDGVINKNDSRPTVKNFTYNTATTLFDYRNGRLKNSYRIRKSGNLLWMWEDLDYRGPAGNFWNTNKSTYYKTQNGICPDGWRMPTSNEWLSLGSNFNAFKSKGFNTGSLYRRDKEKNEVRFTRENISIFYFREGGQFSIRKNDNSARAESKSLYWLRCRCVKND